MHGVFDDRPKLRQHFAGGCEKERLRPQSNLVFELMLADRMNLRPAASARTRSCRRTSSSGHAASRMTASSPRQRGRRARILLRTPRRAPPRTTRPTREPRCPRRTRSERRSPPTHRRSSEAAHRSRVRGESTCRSGGCVSLGGAPAEVQPSRRTPPSRHRGPRCGSRPCRREAGGRTPRPSTTSRSGCRACPRGRRGGSCRNGASRRAGSSPATGSAPGFVRGLPHDHVPVAAADQAMVRLRERGHPDPILVLFVHLARLPTGRDDATHSSTGARPGRRIRGDEPRNRHDDTRRDR